MEFFKMNVYIPRDKEKVAYIYETVLGKGESRSPLGPHIVYLVRISKAMDVAALQLPAGWAGRTYAIYI